MPIPLTLVVLLSSHDPNDPLLIPMRDATQQAIGDETRLTFRVVPELPTDDAALAIEANAIAEVEWLDDGHARALVRFHASASTRWSVREIGFETFDAVAERGKTIGFAIASMTPEEPLQAAPTPPSTSIIVSSSDVTKTDQVHLEEPYRRTVATIDAVAVAAGALNGDGSSLGGGLAARAFLSSNVALRAGVAVRECDIDAAQASAYFVDIAAGASWQAWEATRARPLALGARIDALASFQDVWRVEPDQTTQRHVRWVPGADLFAEGNWLVTSGASVVFGTGVMTTFGRTDVFLRGEDVSKLASLSMVFETGLRARF